jgi:ferredoxin--NADP+ reductase
VWTDGSLDEALGFHPTPDDTHVYLCGNPKMVEGMLEILTAEGFTEHSRRNPGTIHVEKFW